MTWRFYERLEIIVKGNSQDGTGNTMNDGKVIIHGHTGDTTGYAMRAGKSMFAIIVVTGSASI
jgi:formylmethanofuran dehydrogenase subunit C